ncbi:MAG: glycosyltransferase, partial [Candidatus Omnitrophica bacterium]|nr:glycosyltransferase [Candidatus Omnitrophota bacterium]
PSKEAVKIKEALRIVHWASPLSWYKTYKAIKEFSPDILIFNWFTPFTWLQFYTISKLIKKNTNTRILYICHNVLAHESRPPDNFFTKTAIKQGDSFIVHSKNDLENLRKLIPEAEIKQIQHPIYDFFKENPISNDAAQEKIGLKGKILLFFGFIREYKGLKYLIQALPLIREKADVKLLIVGEFWEKENNYRKLISSLGLEEHTKIISGYVPDEDVGMYFSACDLLVLPYISATGSGIVQIANSFQKPVIATRLGCFSDVIKDKKNGYLIEPADPKAIAEAVLDFYSDENKAKNFMASIEKDKFSWDKIREAIEGCLK